MNTLEIISICKKSDTLTKNQYLALYQIILHGDSFEKSEIADLLIDHVNKKSMYLLSVLWKDKDSLVRMCAYDTVSVYPAKFTYNYLISRISKENDELARSYIITSLTDISLREKVQGTMRIFKKLYIKEKSAYWILAYLRAFYLLGNNQIISKTRKYLTHSDYHIRCTASMVLDDLLDNTQNIDETLSFIKERIKKEKSVAVESKLRALIKKYGK